MGHKPYPSSWNCSFLPSFSPSFPRFLPSCLDYPPAAQDTGHYKQHKLTTRALATAQGLGNWGYCNKGPKVKFTKAKTKKPTTKNLYTVEPYITNKCPKKHKKKHPRRSAGQLPASLTSVSSSTSKDPNQGKPSPKMTSDLGLGFAEGTGKRSKHIYGGCSKSFHVFRPFAGPSRSFRKFSRVGFYHCRRKWFFVGARDLHHAVALAGLASSDH